MSGNTPKKPSSVSKKLSKTHKKHTPQKEILSAPNSVDETSTTPTSNETEDVLMRHEALIKKLSSRVESLEGEVVSLEEKAVSLEGKVITLEGKVLELESRLVISERVSSLLEVKVDDQQAYSRRPCLVIAGIEKSEGKDDDLYQQTKKVLKDAKINEKEFDYNLDKLHRIGSYDPKTKSQPVIVKFKSHSFKEKVFFSKKNITNENIKFRPSITKRRMDLLNETKAYIKENKDTGAKFTMANVHGDLRVLIEGPKDDKRNKNGKFFPFNSFMEFLNILTMNELKQ